MQIVVEIVLQKFRYGDRHRYVRSPDVGLQEHRTSRYRGGTDRLHQGWPLSGIQNRLAKTRFRSLKQLKFNRAKPIPSKGLRQISWSDLASSSYALVEQTGRPGASQSARRSPSELYLGLHLCV